MGPQLTELRSHCRFGLLHTDMAYEWATYSGFDLQKKSLYVSGSPQVEYQVYPILWELFMIDSKQHDGVDEKVNERIPKKRTPRWHEELHTWVYLWAVEQRIHPKIAQLSLQRNHYGHRCASCSKHGIVFVVTKLQPFSIYLCCPYIPCSSYSIVSFPDCLLLPTLFSNTHSRRSNGAKDVNKKSNIA